MQLLYERKADRGDPTLHSAHAHRRMPLQKRSRDRLEHLLATAEHVMVERGYERVSANLIARIAGIPVGSICHLFSNKDQILCLLVARAFELHEKEIVGGELREGACLFMIGVLSAPASSRRARLVDEAAAHLIMAFNIAGQQQVVQSFIPGIERLFVRWIEVNHPQVPADRRRAAGVMIKLAITGAMSEMLTHPAAERRAITSELAAMVIEYVHSIVEPGGGPSLATSRLGPRAPGVSPRRRRTPREQV
jgi:AcrR family transcriptional regulator